jgi:hypothetical protein
MKQRSRHSGIGWSGCSAVSRPAEAATKSLLQEPETEIRPFLPHDPSIIRVHASHGFAMAKLREFSPGTLVLVSN